MIFKILIFGFVAYYLIRNLFGGLFKSASDQERRQSTSNPNKKKTTKSSKNAYASNKAHFRLELMLFL